MWNSGSDFESLMAKLVDKFDHMSRTGGLQDFSPSFLCALPKVLILKAFIL